ncbi:unnamed protein product [Pleuronectes platessa]|uniref:Uncharacterized protein n=1 Tax=Pleuronectes platessa TaxID=8262 RepID=A0A9N7UKN6_PLEPL|nr:unnamed protein product [Pleuronectes platessa]
MAVAGVSFPPQSHLPQEGAPLVDMVTRKLPSHPPRQPHGDTGEECLGRGSLPFIIITSCPTEMTSDKESLANDSSPVSGKSSAWLPSCRFKATAPEREADGRRPSVCQPGFGLPPDPVITLTCWEQKAACNY